jgi:hypothetical protein
MNEIFRQEIGNSNMCILLCVCDNSAKKKQPRRTFPLENNCIKLTEGYVSSYHENTQETRVFLLSNSAPKRKV